MSGGVSSLIHQKTARIVRHVIPALLVSILMAAPLQAISSTDVLKIELNKLEDVSDACRVYLVFENRTESAFSTLKLDLVIFDNDGIISKRLAVEGGPLPGGKTSVKLFDISQHSCGGIQRILLNDVLTCKDESGKRNDCVATIDLFSRAGVPYIK